MGGKSQRHKQQRARRQQSKQQKKRKKEAQERSRQFELRRQGLPVVGSNARHRQRLAQQRPQAWAGETPEDVAVFDDTALADLSPEVAEQVSLVRQALQAATQSRGEEALESVAVIPRSSPLSEWRLFLRGLVDWLAERFEPASDTWRRLNPERRPGRIATAMMLALRTDLDQAVRSEPAPAAGPAPTPWERWDDQLLYHAKLLRRVRFDRAALEVAEAGLKVPEESNKLRLGPRKIRWLKQFIGEYGDTEPELTTALAEAALARACDQIYADLFEDAIRAFRGPRHDPRNLLLTFFYYSRFGNDRAAEEKAERALDDYLERELPANQTLSAPLRGAIASQIHLYEAAALMEPHGGGSPLDFLWAAREDSKAIRKHLQAAMKAAPGNLAAYKAYVDWIKPKLDDDRLTALKRMPLEKELADVMRRWSRGRPEDVEPRLWLVDFLLENEHLDEARPHVELLAASRQDDPRVRATPWKWQILEAMRLCRRKAWLAEVPARLDEAEALWPAWLSAQWLPYLRAAWLVRSGQTEAFEVERPRLAEVAGVPRDSLTDACMMLGAAQRMRVPADVLKQFRAPVEQALKGLGQVPIDELIDVGGFFWDLHRVDLVYPAYRMHGGKFGKELVARWENNPQWVLKGIDDPRIHKAVLWNSQYRFWPNNYDTKMQSWLAYPETQKHPMFVAARMNAFLHERHHWGSDKHRELAPVLRAAAGTQRDAYYRYWFAALADEYDEIATREAARFSGFPFGRFFNLGDEDEDDEDDEGW